MESRNLRPDVPWTSKTGFAGRGRLYGQSSGCIGWIGEPRVLLYRESIFERTDEQGQCARELDGSRGAGCSGLDELLVQRARPNSAELSASEGGSAVHSRRGYVDRRGRPR